MENNYGDFHLNESEIVLNGLEQIVQEVRFLREQNKSLNEERLKLHSKIEEIRNFLKNNNIMEYHYVNEDKIDVFPKYCFKYEDKKIII